MFLSPQSQEEVIAQLVDQKIILNELIKNMSFTNEKVSEQMSLVNVSVDLNAPVHSFHVKMAETDQGLGNRKLYFGVTILLVLLIYILYGITIIVIKNNFRRVNHYVKPNKIKIKFTRKTQHDPVA